MKSLSDYIHESLTYSAGGKFISLKDIQKIKRDIAKKSGKAINLKYYDEEERDFRGNDYIFYYSEYGCIVLDVKKLEYSYFTYDCRTTYMNGMVNMQYADKSFGGIDEKAKSFKDLQNDVLKRIQAGYSSPKTVGSFYSISKEVYDETKNKIQKLIDDNKNTITENK